MNGTDTTQAENSQNEQPFQVTVTNNCEFLEAIFLPYGAALKGALPQVLAFTESPDAHKSWGGRRWRGDVRADGMNAYFTLATYRPDTTTKKKGDCVFVCGVMLDDVGTKALPLDRLAGCPPSYVIETSAGNYQAGYLFKSPESHHAKVDALNKALIAAGMCDPGATGVTSRWGRLPFATNTKRIPPFACRLVEFHPDRRYDVDEIAEKLEIGVSATFTNRPQQTDLTDLTDSKPPKKAKKAATHDHSEDGVHVPRAAENTVVSELKARGLYKSALGGGKHDITCPWVHEHTDQLNTGAVYFEPSESFPVGGFKCQHSHGDKYRLTALLDFLGLSFSDAKHKPTIRIVAGELARIVETAEKELAGTGGYFQNGLICAVHTNQITGAPETVPLKAGALACALARVAIWKRYDGRQHEWVNTDPPARHVTALIDAERWRHLPPLRSIARQPFFRENGSLCRSSGYDPESKTFGAFAVNDFFVPGAPSRKDADQALALLRELLTEVKFADRPNDEAAAVGAFLTGAIRSSLPQAPAFLARAAIYASGKSHLTSMMAAFATPGRAVSTHYPTNEQEAEKSLLSTLITAPAVICFDNLKAGGEITAWSKFCTVLSEPFVSGRILGFSRDATVSTRTLILASGNNVSPHADLTRRFVTINLDPQVETPATIRYTQGARDLHVLQHRGQYVSAALTIIAAWMAAGRPQSDCAPLNGYADWTQLVRQPLLWLGMADPAHSVFEAMKQDPDKEVLSRMLTAWLAAFGSVATKVRDVVQRCATNTELREVCAEIAEDKTGEISRRNLGKWIARNAGRVVGELRFERGDATTNSQQWRVKSVKSVKSVNPSHSENVAQPEQPDDAGDEKSVKSVKSVSSTQSANVADTEKVFTNGAEECY